MGPRYMRQSRESDTAPRKALAFARVEPQGFRRKARHACSQAAMALGRKACGVAPGGAAFWAVAWPAPISRRPGCATQQTSTVNSTSQPTSAKHVGDLSTATASTFVRIRRHTLSIEL